jgi:hypothetical protein
MRRNRLSVLMAVTAMLVGSAAHAGLYSDALAKCLVSATSKKDKTDLIRWIFASAAAHPDVSDIACLDGKQRTGMVRMAGELFERLLTVSCRKEFREAVKYEGNSAIESSFTVVGQVAMRDLLADPEVAKVLGELGSFVSQDKLKAALEEKEP